MDKIETRHLHQLGVSKTKYRYDNPECDLLETFASPFEQGSISGIVSIDFPEFTSLCLHGDSLVTITVKDKQINGRLQIQKKISDLVGTKGTLVSFDTEVGSIVTEKYYDVRKTQSNVPCIEIKRTPIIDVQGNEVVYPPLIVTPNHLILVQKGFDKFVWINASSLKPKDRLVNTIFPPCVSMVRSIQDAGKHDVYNMEVENTHCFFANEICVHNCPVTGQPDFGRIIVEYIPNELCVESKSFKLYMMAFRNYHSFMEAMTAKITQDLVSVLQPAWLRVCGIFNARGGTHLHSFSEYYDSCACEETKRKVTEWKTTHQYSRTGGFNT